MKIVLLSGKERGASPPDTVLSTACTVRIFDPVAFDETTAEKQQQQLTADATDTTDLLLMDKTSKRVLKAIS